MATPESKRQAPDRELDSYVAHIKRLINGTEPPAVEDDKFLSPNFISDGTTLTPASLSNIPLGFNVKINGITYSDVHISGYGFLALQEPGNSFSMIDVSTSSDEFRNNLLKATWRVKHVLIAPWWDVCSVPSKDVDTLSTLGLYTTLTPQMIEDIKFGKDVKNWPFHPYDRGVRYKKIYDYTNGVGFIVRWTNLNSSLEVIKFEACIFESGKIQFKYWPTKKYENAPSAPISVDTRSATVGVFYCGFGNYKFRDFAPTIDYQKEKRLLNELGGASYDPSYSDSGQFYSIGIKTDRWPGPAIISFDPPKNPGKFLPRKNSSFISSNKQLTRVGFFDDRKTFNFVSSLSISDKRVVHMPSLLPNRLTGDTSPFINGDTRQLLFTNGSITVASGTTTNSVIDSQIEMLDALDSITKIESDYSFNEFKQNYSVTQSTSSFYTNEKSVELFGEGFTYPLKSKTKFEITLPVELPIQMNPERSSFYWYDKERKSWNLAAEQSNIPSTWIDYPSLIAGNTGESNSIFYNRITETAIGFDAVGRKVVSGSWVPNFLTSIPFLKYDLLQKSVGIGTVVNRSSPKNRKTIANEIAGFGERSVESIEKGALQLQYDNSITDSSDIFPEKSQQIKLGNEYPFLIEKVVVKLPLKATDYWFLDKTTCNRAYAIDDLPPGDNPNSYASNMQGWTKGPIDFGGPALTLAIHSAKGGKNKKFVDLICSGTITHTFDNKLEIYNTQDPGANYISVRPEGFLCFSNPTAVITPEINPVMFGYKFEDNVTLEMEASVHTGVKFAEILWSGFRDGSLTPPQTSSDYVNLFINREFIEVPVGPYAFNVSDDYVAEEGFGRIPYFPVYIQQVSPLSRGTTRIEFNGSSILGPTIGQYQTNKKIKNPFYKSGVVLPTGNITDQSEFVNIISKIDDRISPYLIMPGESISISISKTKPVIHQMEYIGDADTPSQGERFFFGNYILTGSHGDVILNSGSISLTFYGSYVTEGSEYHT
jgi:hypothetical protein